MSRRVVLALPLLALASLAQAAAPPPPAGRYVLDVDATLHALEAAGQAKARTRQTLEQMRGALTITFAGDIVTFAAGAEPGGQAGGRCDWTQERSQLTLQRCRTNDGGPYDPGTRIAVDGEDRIVLQGGAGASRVIFRRE